MARTIHLQPMLRIIFLTLGCLLFAYLLIRIGTDKILDLLVEIGWGFVGIAALYVAHQLTRTLAFWACARTHGPVSYPDLLRVRFSGEAIQFLTFSGLFLSLPAQALLLKQSGLNTTQAFAATVTEYILYNLVCAAMALAALTYLLTVGGISGAFGVAAYVGVWSAGVFLAASAIAISRRLYLIGTVLTGVARLPLIGKRLQIDPAKLRQMEDLLFAILRNPARLLPFLAVEAIAQVPLVLELFVLLRIAGQQFTVAQPILIEAATKFLGIVFFFVPGQVGATEAVYVVVFQAVGLSASSGFGLALARRLRSMLVAGIGLGFLSLARGRQK